MGRKSKAPQLPPLLLKRLIPWAGDGARRMVVARAVMDAAHLPETVRLQRHPPRGPRLIARDNRRYANTRIFSATWPEDELLEIEKPKLVCVLDGEADYQVGEYLLTCNAGHFIIVPPGTPHDDARPHLQESRRQNGSCDLLQIVAYRRGIHCWICQSRGTWHSGVAAENYLIRSEQGLSLFHLMVEEALARKKHHEAICKNLLGTFLMLLQRELAAGRYLLPGPRVPLEESPPASDDFQRELDGYLLAHLNEPLTLDSVARRMHLSRAHFARRIRQQTGQTFIAYLTALRLQEARTLLRESEWTTVTIAEFVGFKSSTYFHRLFRAKMGMTPGEFRSQSRRMPSRQNAHAPKKIRLDRQ